MTVPLLVAGGTVVLTDGFDPERAMRILDQYGCTIVLMVPTMYHMIMNGAVLHVDGGIAL